MRRPRQPKPVPPTLVDESTVAGEAPDVIDDLNGALDGYGSLFSEDNTGRELTRAHETWLNTPPHVRDHITKRLLFLSARAGLVGASESQMASEAVEELGDVIDERLGRIERKFDALIERADMMLDLFTSPGAAPPHPEPIDVSADRIVDKANA